MKVTQHTVSVSRPSHCFIRSGLRLGSRRSQLLPFVDVKLVIATERAGSHFADSP